MYVFFSRWPVKVQELFPHWIYFHTKGSLAVRTPHFSLKQKQRSSWALGDGLEIWKDMPKAHIVKVRA